MNILITGATKGMGKAIALEMAANNYSLALCARNEKELDSLKKELLAINPKIDLLLVKTDCSVKTEVEAFADQTIAHFKTIDVLINNAGLFSPSKILEEEDKMLVSHFNTNVLAPYILYKKIAPLMQKKGKGHIFNICSVASLQTIVTAGSYCVTKAALLSLNNIMREETKPFGVKVTAVIPGSTLTSSWDGSDVSPDKFVLPEDVAKSIHQIMQLSKGANVDQLVITPQGGQV
ncbi:SDR family oxidoreductase [Pedobacter arcticus]|uniref:SDR family oxidoreductase n=1 Tax=Pedobacter arcticus TaxID=752140 RepID=UPI0002F099AA|nr:SDR family NAD(P)-dependent oxidoreductase [Pedobacter arcticus]